MKELKKLSNPGALAIQSNGRIVVAGATASCFPAPDCSGSKILVERLRWNGSLDPSFGGGDGIVTLPTTGIGFKVKGLAIRPDGRIVLAGGSYDPNGATAILQLNPDGKVDGTFGTNGYVVFPSVALSYGTGSARALGLDPQGRILLAGVRNFHFAVVRLLPDGDIDNSFGVDGFASISFGDGGHLATAVKALSDGRVLVAGQVDGVPTPGTSSVGVAMLTQEGDLDPSFGGGSGMTTVTTESSLEVNSPLALPTAILTGRGHQIVIASAQGERFDSCPRSFALSALTLDGAPDPSFGGGDTVSGPGTCITAGDADLARDGDVVAVGARALDVTLPTSIAVARYTHSGSNDVTFGPKGLRLLRVDGFSSGANVVRALRRGRVLVAGSADASKRSCSRALNGKLFRCRAVVLMRFLPNGKLDSSFGGDGVVSTPRFTQCADKSKCRKWRTEMESNETGPEGVHR
ncbi:MAG: hypothetical protein U0R52_00935 [Solirubrobacterales bacterium]